MRLYQLHSIQSLPIPAMEAWDFLSDPENLKTGQVLGVDGGISTLQSN